MAKPINYYKLLSDPKHEWLNDEEKNPFRIMGPHDHKCRPFIRFHFRTMKRTHARTKLVTPVAERPVLFLPRKNGKTSQIQAAYSCSKPQKAKVRFNWEMDYLIKKWHCEATAMGCQHEKPLIQMYDDSLHVLFS